MSELIIETRNLTKYYGKTIGIADLHLQVRQGEIFGFLGPNGAGKSTTIRLLLNLIRPTSGEIRIFGKSMKRYYVKILKDLGNVPGEMKLYEELTGEYFLQYMNRLSNKIAVLQHELINSFQLSQSDLRKKIKYYSHGMKQKLGIIQAMQSDPDLLIMDEPSEGLDPLNKNILYQHIKRFKEKGKTVFFSSHYLAEVEKICDRVGLVRDGKLIAEENISTLKQKMVRRMEIYFAEKIEPSDFRMSGVKIIEHNDKYLLLQITGGLTDLLRRISKYHIDSMIFHEPRLGDTFFSYYKDVAS
jgi:ABC-2 type transport system ATP-binding protein